MTMSSTSEVASPCSKSSPPDYEDNEESLSPSSDRGTKLGGTGKSTVDPKICGVCGDKALGNNFNAITCESCKAFFRRNALRTKEFVCPFSNNCKVDAITRRFCQRCRLKKCFDIGMKKEWIMTDDEKKLKKQKIEQNRLKRCSLENSTGVREDVDIPLTKVQRSVDSLGPSEEEELANDDNLSPSKVPKQPMGLHNPNENLVRTKRIRETRPNVIAIAVSANVDSQPTEQIAPEDNIGLPEPHQQQHPIPLEQTHLPETKIIKVTPTVITQPGWIDAVEGDSSSNSSATSLNQSPPLVNHPPNKRPKLFSEQETLEFGEPINQTPLLSSLIRPAYSESSSDHSNSPPAPPATYTELNGDNDTGGVIVRHEDPLTFPQGINQPNTNAALVLSHSPSIEGYHDELASHNSHQFSLAHQNIHGISSYEQNGNMQRFHNSEAGSHNIPIEIEHRKQCYVESSQIPSPSHCEDVESEMISLPANTMDSILSVAIAAEFNAFGMLGTNTSRELNKAEQAKLSELLLASQALHAPVDAERPIKVSESSDPSLLNVINLTEIAIRRLIKMSKKISGFKNMCQEDQIALLKGGSTEMMILRSAVTYDPLKDSWEIPHSNPGQYNIQLGVLKKARGNLYEEHQRFVKSFRAEWRKDENIMIILCAITLFTPERLNVIHKDVVKLEQDSYYYLLKRYLESILNGCEAKSTYLKLIRKIAELRALNSSHVRVFLEMNPKEVEPLLIEIFDLK